MSLILKNIKKSFGKVNVLNGVDIKLEKGEITGILGNNGSGKTTLMKIISGIYNLDSGTIENLEYTSNVLDVCNMMENPNFNESLTVIQNLKYYIDLSIDKSFDFKYYVKVFNIDFLDKKFKKLSLGMKQKVAMLYIFLKKSKILLLDELTNGLDERIIKVFFKELKKYVKENNAYVLIASHKIYELQNICDVIYFLIDGKIKDHLILNQNKENINNRKIFIFKDNLNANEFKNEVDVLLDPILLENQVSVISNGDDELKKLILLSAKYNLVNLIDDNTTLENYYFNLIEEGVK